MSGKIRNIDTWLLQKVAEPLSWRIEAATGYDNFHQARAVLMAYFVANCMIWFVKSPPDYGGVAMGITISVALYWYSFSVESRTRPGTLSPARTEVLNTAVRLLAASDLLLVCALIWKVMSIRQMMVLTEAHVRYIGEIQQAVLWFGISGISGLLFSYLLMCNPPPQEHSREMVPQSAG